MQSVIDLRKASEQILICVGRLMMGYKNDQFNKIQSNHATLVCLRDDRPSVDREISINYADYSRCMADTVIISIIISIDLCKCLRTKLTKISMVSDMPCRLCAHKNPNFKF